MEKQHDQKGNSKNTTNTMLKDITLICGLLICAALLSVNAYALGGISPTSLVVNYQLSQIPELDQGETGNAVIVIQNAGDFEATNVEVVIHDTKYLSANSYWKLGNINPGRSVSIVVPLKVSKDAKIGTNFLTLFMDYKSYSMSEYGTKNVENVKNDWLLSVKVKGTPLFSLKNFSTDGNPEPGKKFGLNVHFENNKGEAKNTYIMVGNNKVNQQTTSVSAQSQSASSTVSSSQQAQMLALQGQSATPGQMSASPSATQTPSASANSVLSVIGTNKKFFGDIKQGQEISAKVEIYVAENAASGVYNFPIKIRYDDRGITKTDEFTIGIFVSGQENIIISDITSEPTKFYAKDKDVKLNLKVQNTGSKEVDYLKISPVFDFPFKNSKSYSQMKNLGKLNAGDEKSSDFYFDIDDLAKEGTYEVKFLINYKADGIVKEENISATVEVQEKPNFEISYDSKTVTGEKDTMKLKVKNVGADCDDVKIYTIKKTDLPLDWTTTSQYIGNLKNNEEGEAILEFSVKSGAKEQTYLSPVEIRCVKNNEVFVQSEKIKIEVDGGKSGTNISNYYIYLVILAIILIIIAIVVKFKKAKK
ncbi:MAG: hypothetical protein CVT89_00785 [Candidatus Altiarchaeales archaeon HGW-Altiarchaeales-2]|nr:MAG: hypothetical protein CVT89_00785 [Candidatus Altiarchaeales archaeon HGW-Altiarchaeales-2]